MDKLYRNSIKISFERESLSVILCAGESLWGYFAGCAFKILPPYLSGVAIRVGYFFYPVILSQLGEGSPHS